MRYLYVISCLLLCVLSGWLGYRLAPSPRVSEVPGPTVYTETERVVIQTAAGSVETRVTERKTVQPTVVAKVPSQYRLSALMPIDDYKDVTVGAACRLAGSVWLESQFNLKRKEVLLGVSIEL